METSKILQALETRYATKQFDSEKKISETDMETLRASLRLAPSSYGLQPWKFHIITNPEIREKLRAASWNQPQITDASHLVVLTGRTSITEEDISAYMQDISATRGVPLENLAGFHAMIAGSAAGLSEEQQKIWNAKQVYIALGFLLETAALLGIDSTPMEGFDPKQYDAILGLENSGYSTAVVCPLGYRSEQDAQASYKKVRFPEEKLFVFHD